MIRGLTILLGGWVTVVIIAVATGAGLLFDWAITLLYISALTYAAWCLCDWGRCIARERRRRCKGTCISKCSDPLCPAEDTSTSLLSARDWAEMQAMLAQTGRDYD